MNIQDKNLYYIGGVVRDELLGKESFDTDLTYVGNAIDFGKNIKDAQIIRINEPFGTIKIKINDEEIDIASTRNEVYPHKGHLPEVFDIGCSLKDDVLRRDFTINALAKSTLTGEIVDYTGGLNDIKNKTLRVLHENSFTDDPTRIVRGLKFSVRFGFEPDDYTKKLQEEYLKNINYDMSYKRLKKELEETFNLNNWEAFERFINQNIYKLIAPQEFNLPKYNFSKLIDKIKPKNIWIIYVGLLPDIDNLPLTKTEKNIVNNFIILKNTKLNSDFKIYKTFSQIEPESIIMYSTINPEIAEKYFNELSKIKLEIKGKDLIDLGFEQGEQFRECFDYILEQKIKNPDISKQGEIKLAKDFFTLK